MTNTLLEKIIADADAQVAAIKAKAEAEVATIEKETERVVSELKTEAAQLLEKKKAQLELVATAKAKQLAKIATQAEKRAQIDALFAAVADEIVAESSEQYIVRYTKRTQAELPKDADVLSVTAPVNRVEETKQILSALSVKAEVITDSQVRAGLIVATKDGVYDISFDRQLAAVRPALEMELVKTTF